LTGCGGRYEPEEILPYMDPRRPVGERVDDLISRMTLEEKISQMMNSASAIDRLGIPEYNWWNEALHGVARAGRATVFPQAIGLAATWDEDHIFKVATAISDEARAKYHEFIRKGKHGIYEGLTFWSPNINIFRDPRWGRGMETYGEDPWLTGRLSVQFVKGMQGNDPGYLKTVATPKHYAVHSGPEPERHSFDAVVDERDLRETYLPAFRASIVEGGAYSVMCAYNRFLGEACCSSDYLLGDILRGQYGFEGYVVSDCGAISNIYRANAHNLVETPAEAAAAGVKAGTDLNCGSIYRFLGEAVEQGFITESEIDVSVRRLFTARFRLGMFDPPGMVPWAGIRYRINDSKKHSDLALETTRKSIVLLKNESGILPLTDDLGTIAVIGPNANEVSVLLGNYNGTPSDPVTPLEGIRRRVSASTTVLYSKGCDLAHGLPTHEVVPTLSLYTLEDGVRINGLKGEYFDNRNFTGEPLITRIDEEIDFNWWDGAPDRRMNTDDFGVRWSGELVPSVSGTHSLALNGFGGVRLFFEGEELVEYSSEHHPRIRSTEVSLEAGTAYSITIEYWELNSDATMQFLWAPPAEGLHEQAVQMAREADTVILVMGLSPRLEGEEMRVEVPGFRGGDRLDLRLPQIQEELIREIGAMGKSTVLLLLNGSALAVNWANQNIPAIVEAWYPGQAAGTAIADVLFGDYNPAGRLPVTFYRSIDQLPGFTDYTMTGKTYRYFDGEPLYPFGHGLSYTTFEYSNLKLPENVRTSDDVTVSVDVRNTGTMAGEEVVQLYLTDLETSAPVPIRSLQGFDRIYLRRGQKKTISFILTPRQLSLIDSEYRRVVEPGTFEVSVGGKQPGFTGNADTYTTGVVTGRFDATGSAYQLPER
jgi:beta-glucosidase